MGVKFKGLKDFQYTWTLEHEGEVLRDETEVAIRTRLFWATCFQILILKAMRNHLKALIRFLPSLKGYSGCTFLSAILTYRYIGMVMLKR